MNTDKIIASSAMIISICALSVSIWQGMVAREHNRLSVKPNLLITPYLEGHGGKNGIYLSNDGLGPGIITHASITINNKDYDLSKNPWPAVFNDINIKSDCFALSWAPSGATLKASEEKALIQTTRAELDGCYFETKKLITDYKIKINIDYKSIYNEYDHTSSIASLRKSDFDF